MNHTRLRPLRTMRLCVTHVRGYCIYVLRGVHSPSDGHRNCSRTVPIVTFVTPESLD
jgi:hypothetical protein